MDIAKMKEFFENLPGVSGDAFKIAWPKHAAILASATNIENIMQVFRIFVENGIECVDSTYKIPIFTNFAYMPQELTPERIASLQLMSEKSTQRMGR